MKKQLIRFTKLFLTFKLIKQFENYDDVYAHKKKLHIFELTIVYFLPCAFLGHLYILEKY